MTRAFIYSHQKRAKLGCFQGWLTDQWGNQIPGSFHLYTFLTSACYLSPSVGFQITAGVPGNMSFHSNVHIQRGNLFLFIKKDHFLHISQTEYPSSPFVQAFIENSQSGYKGDCDVTQLKSPPFLVRMKQVRLVRKWMHAPKRLVYPKATGAFLLALGLNAQLKAVNREG